MPRHVHTFSSFSCVIRSHHVLPDCVLPSDHTLFLCHAYFVWGLNFLLFFILLLLHAGRTSLNGKYAMAPRTHVLQVHTYHPPRDVVIVRNSPEMSSCLHVSKAAFGFHSLCTSLHTTIRSIIPISLVSKVAKNKGILILLFSMYVYIRV